VRYETQYPHRMDSSYGRGEEESGPGTPKPGPSLSTASGDITAHDLLALGTQQSGHITASAWVVDRAGTMALLTHHRKLGRWLQLGGHADGDPDVRRVALREAMEAAAHRDSIAAEYATGFAIVFDTGLRLLADALLNGAPTLDAIVSLHVGLLASYPDTLIERKAGPEVARTVMRAAREVRDGTRSLADFDASLRRPDHRLNPGTSADLVAATLLAALLSGTRLP